jgi:hypothetical protein
VTPIECGHSLGRLGGNMVKSIQGECDWLGEKSLIGMGRSTLGTQW